MLLTSDIALHDLPGRIVKIPEKICRQILENDSDPIYAELGQTLHIC